MASSLGTITVTLPPGFPGGQAGRTVAFQSDTPTVAAIEPAEATTDDQGRVATAVVAGVAGAAWVTAAVSGKVVNRTRVVVGDAETGSVAVLPDVGAPGTFGGATTVPRLTTDAKGRVTGVEEVPIVTGLTDLPDAGPGAGAYGGAGLAVQTLTLDAKGRVANLTTGPATGFYRGVVADDAARDALPSKLDGHTVLNRLRQKLQWWDAPVALWRDVMDAPMATFNPMSFGAKFDGVADDTQAWADCIAAVKARAAILFGNSATSGGGRIVTPPGNTLVQTVVFENMSGVALLGAGPSATQFVAKSLPTGTPLVVASDQFGANGVDAAFWTTTLSGAGAAITQPADGLAHFAVTGFGYSLLRAKTKYDFALPGAELFAEPGATLAEQDKASIILHNSTDPAVSDSYELCREGGNLVAKTWVGAIGWDAKTVRGTVAADVTAARYWRIRRATDGSGFEFAYSADGATWATFATYQVSPPPATMGSSIGILNDGTGHASTTVTFTQYAYRAPDYDRSKPVIDVRSCRYMLFAQFSVDAGSGTKARLAGIRSGNLAVGRQVTSTSNRYEHVFVYNGRHGWFWQGGPSSVLGDALFTDQNNDLNTLVACAARFYVQAGYRIGHSQSKNHRCFGCEFEGTFNGEAALRDNWQVGVLVTRGSIRFYDGGGGANSGADFALGGPNDNIVIHGNDSERSNRFIVTGSGDYVEGTSATQINGVCGLFSMNESWSLSVTRNRIADNQIHPDSCWIRAQHGGPVTIAENELDAGGSKPQVRVDSDLYTPVTIAGNNYASPGTADTSINWPLLIRRTGAGSASTTPAYHLTAHGNGFRIVGGNANAPRLPVNGAAFYPRQSETYYTANTAATLVTTIGNPLTGLRIVIVAGDANTTIQHNAGVRLAGGADFAMALGDVLILEALATSTGAGAPRWVEVGRRTGV